MAQTKIWRTAAATLLLCLLLVAVPATPAQALSGTISINPQSGPVGTVVSVTASNFTASVNYTVTFAGASVATGNTTTGSFTASFAVPSYPRGSYPITITTASDSSNSLSYTVTPAIALSTGAGYVGDQIVVAGTGFTASSTVTIYFDTTAVTTVTTTASGTFSNIAFPAPDSIGGTHLVKGSDVSGDSPSLSFTTVPKIAVSPISGVVGGQVTVGGTGFYASLGVTIYFDDTVLQTIQTNSLGTFANVTLTIPESYRGSHTVKALDTGGSQATASFTISQAISINPTSGTSDSKVTISGSGFKPDTVITISFDTADVVTTPALVTSNSKGSFSASFTIPATAGGTHQIKASDGTNTDTKAFSILSSLSLNPTSGFVGAKITVSGSGFQASQPITITFYNKSIVTAVTDAYGKFNAIFTVPAYPADTYKVTASDGTNVQEASFIISTTASINQTTGYVGTALTASGVGFTVGRTVTITYDGNLVATATVNTDGSFSTNFNVPASKGGGHTIIATDTTNTMQFTFIMESTPPEIPAPLKPEMGSKAKAEAHFDWEDVTDPSSITYTLQIATNKDFPQASIVLEKTGLTQSEYTLTREERLKSVSKETPYYWHVKAVDGASNESRWTGAGWFYVGFFLALPQPVIYTLIGVGALLLAIFAFWFGRKTTLH